MSSLPKCPYFASRINILALKHTHTVYARTERAHLLQRGLTKPLHDSKDKSGGGQSMAAEKGYVPY